MRAAKARRQPTRPNPVPGETNLYSSTLWLMKSGGYSVDVNVEGDHGGGTVIVPVNAVATNTLGMSRALALLSAALAILLFVGAIADCRGGCWRKSSRAGRLHRSVGNSPGTRGDGRYRSSCVAGVVGREELVGLQGAGIPTKLFTVPKTFQRG